MTDQEIVAAPALIGIGAQSIVERAASLGLTWTMRPATVTVPGASDAGIQYDGDTESIPCVNLTGSQFAVGDRVMGVMVPPSANYIIGSLAAIVAPSSSGTTTVTAMTNGTTTSVAYANLPGNPSVTISKAYDTETNLDVFVSGTFFATGIPTGLEIAVLVNGTDYSITGLRLTNAALGSRLPYSGVLSVTGLVAGSYTVVGRWRVQGALGTLNTNNGDFFSMNVREVAA